MNYLHESSHTRTMSTDSMPSNVSEDFSGTLNGSDPYQIQSCISLDKKVLSDFNRSNYPITSKKKVSHPTNIINLSSNNENKSLTSIKSEILVPPKVHVPYQSQQKKIIKECKRGGRERQTVGFNRSEDTRVMSQVSYHSDNNRSLQNRVKRLPLDMPLQISPKPKTTIDVGQMSQKKTDINRQSRSFDEGYGKQHPNELLGVNRIQSIQKLQSPKSFTYCLPKVISVDKATENFLSGGTSQLSESNIENKNPLNGSSLLIYEDKLKSKLSPEGKTMNKMIGKDDFNFTNILLDAEKKLNQTPQQSTSRFSPKKMAHDPNAIKGEFHLQLQQDPLYYVEIEQGTPSHEFVLEQANKVASQSVKRGIVSVPQSLINTKSSTKNSKENKKPLVSTGSSTSKSKKSTKHVWNNYTQQVRQEMKQNFPIKENKKLLINTLFEFDPTSPSNVHSSGLDSNTSNLDRPTAGNSKPSTFYTMLEERHTEKPKTSLKKDRSRDSMEISLPLQMDNSRNDPSILSITNRERPHGSLREDQGRSYDQRSMRKKCDNNQSTSILTCDPAKMLSKDNSIRTENPDLEINQSASSFRSRKDEDLSEFIRIELGLGQEEQIFQPPCLIRTSYLLKKGISQAIKEMENKEKSQEQEESGRTDSAYSSNTIQNLCQGIPSELRGAEDHSYLNKSSNGNPLSSFNGMDRSNLSNLNPDITDSFTLNERPKASRRIASKGYSKSGNFVKCLNISNATVDSKNENYSTQPKSSKEPTMPFEELTSNIISNKRMIDLLNRKNESMLLHMLEKSGLSGTNSSSDENALQTSIRALLQAEQHKNNLQSIELFRSSNRLPTIEEMNSVHMQLNTRPDNNPVLPESDKGRISVSHFSDRCISEPNGFCFKKTMIYEPDLISKSFDDVNCVGYSSNKVINKNYLVPQDELLEKEYHSHISPRMRKSQSESRMGSLQLVQRLFLQSQKMTMEGTQGMKSFKTPTGQMQRLKSFIQTGDTIVESRNRRGNSAKSISRTKDFSVDYRDHRSISRINHSKRSSVAADRSRDINKFAFTLIEVPQNIQTYTIIDPPKRSASSDPSKRKMNEKSLSSTHLTPVYKNLQKRIASQNALLTCKEHQKSSHEKFGKIH